MFTTKQSDIFYNDQTKEMFVCKVSSISAKRCEGSEDIVYGALPIVYKINKETNYQSLIYPKNLDTFKDDIKSDLYDLVPSNCYADGTNFAHVTKPLINYNKSSDRYSITFVGKYTATSDGFGVLNYIFQYIDTDFHLLDSEIYIPKAKATKTPPFTFNSGYLNSDLIIGGNKLRWNEPVDTAYAERVANYVIKPTHLDHNNSLGFNLIQYCPPKGQHCYLPTTKYPLLWSGGYITYNPKYTAFDPAYDIRVDFRARSFNVPSMTAYKSIQSSNDDSEPSRWLDTATALSGLSGAGSGFCVYFYNAPTRHPIEWVREGIVEPNGIGSTLGYAIAGNVGTEDGGELTEVNGLVVNPSGNIGGQTGPDAESFLGVGFDIRGDFCTTSESKEGWLSASDTFKAPTASTWTTSPCSVGIRGNRNHYTRVLTCVPMVSVVAASAVPMHEDASTSGGGDVAFQDYRVDLTNKGTRVTVYNKLTSATDYNTIVQLDLNKTYGCVGYDAWGNIGEPLITNPTLTPLNVGLSFTTSEYCSYFELSSFEVTGVKIGNPNKTPKEIDNVTTVEYLEESSANLRRDLVTLPTTDPVDITMLIKHESLIDRINLCGNLLPPVEYEIEEKWTGTKEIVEFKPPPRQSPPPSECQPGWYDIWGIDGTWGSSPVSNITQLETYAGVTYYTTSDSKDYFEIANNAGDRYLLGVTFSDFKGSGKGAIFPDPGFCDYNYLAWLGEAYSAGTGPPVPGRLGSILPDGYVYTCYMPTEAALLKEDVDEYGHPALRYDLEKIPVDESTTTTTSQESTIPDNTYLIKDLHFLTPNQNYMINGRPYKVLYKYNHCEKEPDFFITEPKPEGCYRITLVDLAVMYSPAGSDIQGIFLDHIETFPVGPNQAWKESILDKVVIPDRADSLDKTADYYIKLRVAKANGTPDPDGICYFISVLATTKDENYETGGNKDPIWGERIDDTKAMIKDKMKAIVRGL